MDLSVGHCQCGCGGRTRVVKGKPRRFIQYHQGRRKGLSACAWKGGRVIDNGYVSILLPNHQRADKKGYVREHILIVEKALGKPLPLGSMPHHIDGNPANNKNSNLVACQDMAYHKLLHRRTRAFLASGHASWMKCEYCHRYDDPKNLSISKTRETRACHKTCRNDDRRNGATKGASH